MPNDYGSRVADKAIASTAKKIHGLYQQAGKDLQKKMDEFLDRHKKKGTEMLEKLKNGEITQEAYHSWMRGQVFIGKQWERKIDQAARIMNDANNEAVGVVRDGRINVFAENYNYEAYELEKKAKGVVSFDLYDERTTARLIKDKPKMLPEWKIDEPKDYKWNRQKVENAITQGIIQGEGIDQITGRMVKALCTGNENKMRTFARTSITGAQNAGRQTSMEDAEDMGIKVKKRWLATLDNRTRDTHAELDGEEVPVDKPFEVDGMEIMFPGDPSCKYPEMVYNCRCTMIEVYEGIDRKTVRRAYEDEERIEVDEDGNVHRYKDSYEVENMTYKEWKEWKENGRPDQRQSQKAEEQSDQQRTISGKEVDKDGRLIVDDAALIEAGKEENEERAREIKEYDEKLRESYNEASKARVEAYDLRREYSNGMISEEEYEKRREEITKKRREAESRSIEFSKKRDSLMIEEYRSCNSDKLIKEAEKKSVAYDAPKVMETPRNVEEIVSVLGGGDLTDGSCASLGFCYIGQKDGIDVVDFRGGSSQTVFSRNARGMLHSIAKETGNPLLQEATKTGTGGAIKLAKQMQEGKEYYFITARHAAIMRKSGDMIEYMELQSATGNGWKTFGSQEDRSTLDRMFRWRFGSSSRITGESIMMDIDDMKGSKILQRAYGYMNTAAESQKKGIYGTIK